METDGRAATMKHKGRGAVSNPNGRFETLTRHPEDDGWWLEDEDTPPTPRTEVTDEASRSIISRNTSPDIPFEQSVNPYRGCEHGCVYCYARPSHAWLGLSPGLDFETRLIAKPDAAGLLERELRRPGYVAKVIMLGANTDPYQPIERQRRLSRSILEVLSAFEHPVAINTRSALVLRDLDLLAPMAERGLARVGISLTTLDDGLAGAMEPRAARPRRRLDTMRALATAGVPVGVMAAPMIPALNDWELERILEAAAGAGAGAANTILLRLPHELAALFEDWLRSHVPDRATRVLNQLRESREGKLDTTAFGRRMSGSGPHARLLARRFQIACRKLGLEISCATAMGLDTGRFRPPPRPGDQLALF